MTAAEPAASVARAAGGKRIVIATWGSFGDLHPYLALAIRLKARGHLAVMAAPEFYRRKVEAEGIEHAPLGPDFDQERAAEIVRKIMDPRRGMEFMLQQLLLPHLRQGYEELLAACRGADLLLTHSIIYAGPMVAEKLALPRAAGILQPMIFMSAYDPPVPPQAPDLAKLYGLGVGFRRVLFRMAKEHVDRLAEPVHRLRAELGLPARAHPVFEGQYSSLLNLALFSRCLGAPQRDWPENTVVTGFPFYDRLEAGMGMPPELEAFLDCGPPPVVFTLGTSAVWMADDFYLESARAARALGRRAVLLAGKQEWNRIPDPLPEGVIAVDYAPHGELFPRAAAVVHQGGAGTTGQALRSGRPALIVPFAHDQPDHGYRVSRLGTGLTLARRRYRADTAAAALRRLLEEPRFGRRAEEVGREVRAETGADAACDALERLLAPVG